MATVCKALTVVLSVQLHPCKCFHSLPYYDNFGKLFCVCTNTHKKKGGATFAVFQYMCQCHSYLESLCLKWLLLPLAGIQKNYRFWLVSNDIRFPSNFTKICSPIPHQNLFTRSPSKSVHLFPIKICPCVPHKNLFTHSPSKSVHPFPIKICPPIPHQNLFTCSPSKSDHLFPIKICPHVPHKNLFTYSRVETWTSRWRVRVESRTWPSQHIFLSAHSADNTKLHLTIQIPRCFITTTKLPNPSGWTCTL
jgi:hypothetical protein